ncbi:MAG: TonB-dependent receptor [Pseudomonadota bacterium]
MRWQICALAAALASAAPLAPAQTSSPQLEEVLVTAQHREESLRETPISLVTFNQEQLEKQRISNITNLNGLVPNFNIDSFPENNSTLRLFIRGVGLTDTQITQDAAVGVYLNNAYIARSTGLAFDVADLERIEILRGPQGTLYGRNTTGGALKLVTKKPDLEYLEFDQTVSAGNQDLFSSKTSANIPFGERYAAKAAYFFEEVDGYIDNTGPGGSFGDKESKGFRFDLRADFTDSLIMDYAYDVSKIKYYNYTPQAVFPRPSGGGLDDLLAIIGNIAENYIDYSTNRIGTLSTVSPLLPTDTEIEGHTLNIEWLVNDSVTLRSITAYRELDDKRYIDFSSGSSEGFRINFFEATIGAEAGTDRLDLPTVRPHLTQDQFSQEFQLLGNIGDRWDYMAGVYYFEESADEDSPLHHIFSAFPFADNGTIYNYGSEFNSIDNKAYAFFTQWTWTPDLLEDRLHLTLGWRYSKDNRKATRAVLDRVVLDNVTNVAGFTESDFDASGDKDFDDSSIAAIVEYDLSDTKNAYIKYAEAYKSGGFNIRDPDEASFENGFEEEKLQSYEAGLKGEFMDRRLRLNSAVFYQEFKDYQYNFQIPGTIQNTRVFNVDGGEMSGIELDVSVLATQNLFFQASYAYLDSELDDVISPITGELEQFDFTNAPEHTYSLMADYVFSAVTFGVLSVNASYNYVDTRQKNNADTFRGEYDLINARLSLSEVEGLGGLWSAALWGKNLQDSDYEAFTFDNLPQATRAITWADGISFGIDISYSFSQ